MIKSRLFKGQIQEELEMFVLVLGMLISITLLFSIASRHKISMEQMIDSEMKFDVISYSLNGINFYYVPGINEPLSVVINDLLAFGDDDGMVYYGWGYGQVNNTDIIIDYFNKTLGRNWYVVLGEKEFKGRNFENCNNILTYTIPIPISSYVGKIEYVKVHRCV